MSKSYAQSMRDLDKVTPPHSKYMRGLMWLPMANTVATAKHWQNDPMHNVEPVKEELDLGIRNSIASAGLEHYNTERPYAGEPKGPSLESLMNTIAHTEEQFRLVNRGSW